jgi:hypothetical protein
MMGPHSQFSAEAFLVDLNEGRFDGRLHEELGRLTPHQLLEISRLMAQQITGKKGAGKPDAAV